MDPDLDRLRFLLAGLREPPPSKQVEEHLLALSEAHWPPRKARGRAEAVEEQIAP